MTSDRFDPYLEWLGIGPDERPLHHYRLLGLPIFESDPDAIRAAADERMLHVRTFQAGVRAEQSQRLLNELAAAKTCLLDPDTKATYDAVLQGQLASQRTVSAVSPSIPPVWPPTVAPSATPPTDQGPPTSTATAAAPPPPPVESRVPSAIEADEPSPFYFQPWVGVLLVAGVVLLGVSIWAISVAMRADVDTGGAGTASPMPASEFDEESEPSEQHGGPSSDGTANDAAPEDGVAADAVMILQEADGKVNLSAATATIEGSPRLVHREGKNLLTGINSSEDRVHWRLRIEKPGAFRIEGTYATSPESAGGTFVLATEDQKTKTLSTRSTGGPETFTSEPIGFIWLRRSGHHRLTLIPQQIAAGHSLMTLESLRLVPVPGTSPP